MRILLSILLFVQFTSANSLSLVDNNDGTWNVIYSSDNDISNFSFTVEGTAINNISHGVTHSAGFWIDAMGSYANGFSTTGKSIPEGQGVLVVIDLASFPTGLSNIFITDSRLITHTYADASKNLTHLQKKLLEANNIQVDNVEMEAKSATDSIRLDDLIKQLDDIENVVLWSYENLKQLEQDSISIRLDNLTKQLDDIESMLMDMDLFQTPRIAERYDSSTPPDTLKMQQILQSGSDGDDIDSVIAIDETPQNRNYEEAKLVLVGDIVETTDASGNTILNGKVKNEGNKRADFSKIVFTFRMNWQGDTKHLTLTAIINGITNTGISSDNSIFPQAFGNFKLVIPRSFGFFIGYKYDIVWK